MDSVQKAAVRALNFGQGDAEGFRSAQTDFTPQGWDEFMKQMRGFLDDKGAPTFNSKFVPSGKAVVISNEKGIIHLQIPGTLTQTQGGSSTVYRHAELDVQAAGKPPKIERLETVYRVH